LASGCRACRDRSGSGRSPDCPRRLPTRIVAIVASVHCPIEIKSFTPVAGVKASSAGIDVNVSRFQVGPGMSVAGKDPDSQGVGDPVVNTNTSTSGREIVPLCEIVVIHRNKITPAVHPYAPAVLRAGLEHRRLENIGAKYPAAFTDADGDHLDGAQYYKLHLPKDIPVAIFWSVTVYGPWLGLRQRPAIPFARAAPSVGAGSVDNGKVWRPKPVYHRQQAAGAPAACSRST
jgi:hypothetical protein